MVNKRWRYGCAFLISAIYAIYWGYCLYLSALPNPAQSQVLLAYVSFPTSFALLAISDFISDWFGPYGSPARLVLEWGLLLIAGAFQYFCLGYVIGIVFPMKERLRAPR
jgi:hypothetical protein